MGWRQLDRGVAQRVHSLTSAQMKVFGLHRKDSEMVCAMHVQEKKTRDTDVLVWYPSEKLKGKRIAVKDNFLLRGTPTTCSSRMLQGEPNRNDLAPSTILTVKKSCHRIRLSIYSDLGPTPLGLWSSDNSQNPDG